jgi:hypothetical protein
LESSKTSKFCVAGSSFSITQAYDQATTGWRLKSIEHLSGDKIDFEFDTDIIKW